MRRMKHGRFGVEFNFSRGGTLTFTVNTIEEEAAMLEKALTDEKFAAIDDSDGATTIINTRFLMWCRSVRS